MSEELGTDDSKAKLLERPIRSINKKMVLVAFSVAILAIFVVIYLIPSSPGGKSVEKPDLATFMEGRRFPELQQLPESYDDVEPGTPTNSPEPVNNSPQDFDSPANFSTIQPTPTQSEHEAAKKSSVLFGSNRQDDREIATAYSPESPDIKPPKNNLLFSQKEQFMRGNGQTGPGSLQRTASPYSVLQGTLIPAVLLSEINSDLPGPVLAQVKDNIFNTTTGKHLLIPQGTKIVGEYNSSVSNGQKRAQVVWSRLIFPNGNSMDLGRMPSVDGGGASGHQGLVNNHYDKLALGVLVTSLLSAGVGMSSGSTNPGAASPQQIIGQSVGQEVARVGTKMAERSLDISPTLTVKSGTRINIFSMSDLKLVPYKF